VVELGIKIDQIEHKKELLLPNTLNPTSVSERGYIYTRDGYGYDELIYKDSSDNEVNLVSDGYVQLPPAIYGNSYTWDAYYSVLNVGFEDNFDDSSFDSRWYVDTGTYVGNSIAETTELTIVAASNTGGTVDVQPFIGQRFTYSNSFDLYAYVILDDYATASDFEGAGIFIGDQSGNTHELRCWLAADGSGGLKWAVRAGGSTDTIAATQNYGWILMSISNGYVRGFYSEGGSESDDPFFITDWTPIDGGVLGAISAQGIKPKFIGLTVYKLGSALEITARFKRFIYRRG
jgi:hypothetical protein